MRLDFKHRIKLKEEARNMESEKNKLEEEWEQSMIQSYNMDEETEDNDMRLDKKENDEQLRENNLRSFPSMSNKSSNQEQWSFSPVIPVYKNGEIKKYVSVISAYDLATWFENGNIRYIPSIQRGSITSSSGKEKDNFSSKHVKEIFKAYTDNKIFGNTIVLNYSSDNESELIYDPDEKKISGEGYLQAVDCSHRARAAMKWKSAWSKHPEQYEDPRQFQFGCEINNISDDEARQMFAEYNNFSLKVNKTRTSFLDISNNSNQIVRKIMSESDLKGRIETVSMSIKSSSPSIVTFGVLSNAIKKNYNPQTKVEQKQVENWLVEFIDGLVSVFPKFMANPNLEERNNLKRQYFTIEPLAFNAYITLSKTLQNDDNWKEKLAKLAENDFLSRTAERWKPILRNEDKVINTSASMKYFEDQVIDWCTK